MNGIYWGEYSSDLGAYKNHFNHNGYGYHNTSLDFKSQVRPVRSI